MKGISPWSDPSLLKVQVVGSHTLEAQEDIAHNEECHFVVDCWIAGIYGYDKFQPSPEVFRCQENLVKHVVWLSYHTVQSSYKNDA